MPFSAVCDKPPVDAPADAVGEAGLLVVALLVMCIISPLVMGIVRVDGELGLELEVDGKPESVEKTAGAVKELAGRLDFFLAEPRSFVLLRLKRRFDDVKRRKLTSLSKVGDGTRSHQVDVGSMEIASLVVAVHDELRLCSIGEGDAGRSS